MRLVALLGLLLALSASSAIAQFVQYTPPGELHGPAEARELVLERAMRQARWRFGRLLVNPWLELRNVGYQDGLTETATSSADRVSDFSASVGAGLNTYMTIGADFIWGTFVLPEYVWWQDLTERRRLNGRYGTGLFGNLGRIGIEATASRFEQPRILGIEIDEPFNQQADQGVLDLSVDIGKGLLVFARAEERRYRSLESESFAGLRRLDRDETIYRAGVGFVSTRGIKFGLGVEESTAEFPLPGANRSNDGSAVFVDAEYDGPLFKLAADFADRSIEPGEDSTFVKFEGETASVNLTFRITGPVWLDVFGRRDLAYSVQEDVAYIEGDGLGVGLSTALGSRARLRTFFEQGESAFIGDSQTSGGRVDDRMSFGGSLSFDLGRASLSLNALSTDYDSNFPENNRKVTRVTTSLAFGKSLRRSSPWG